MAGRQALDLVIGVRVSAPERERKKKGRSAAVNGIRHAAVLCPALGDGTRYSVNGSPVNALLVTAASPIKFVPSHTACDSAFVQQAARFDPE